MTTTRRIVCGTLLLLLALSAACSGGQPARPLPPITPLPAGAVLMYRVVENDPATRDETILLYPEGQVSYVESVNGRKGSQFIMPGGVQRFLDTLQSARFASLSESYRPRNAQTKPIYYTLSARLGGAVKTVQWEAPQTPPGLADFLREWDQFLDVIRASTH
jgi:hypothetical protein